MDASEGMEAQEESDGSDNMVLSGLGWSSSRIGTAVGVGLLGGKNLFA